MRIAILTSGIMPVPAVRGGAVECLIDSYLEYNREHSLHDITVYSIGGNDIPPDASDCSNHYVYINVESRFAKIRKHLFKLTNKDGYYYFGIEYYLSRALRLIGKSSYDLIIIENRPGFALKMPENMSAKLVLHLHNDFLNTASRGSYEIFRRLSCVVCVSDYISGIVDRINPAVKKTVTVHNGIDIKSLTGQGNNDITRTRIGLQPDDFVIIYTGRLIPEKGISELIDAIILLSGYSDIKLIVAGSSILTVPGEGDRFLTTMKDKAAKLKDRIIFTGQIPHSDIGQYLRLADIAVIPSTWGEPFGLTCVEAMAAGLPVITTDRGGLPEITDTDCAITVNPEKDFTVRLADAIRSLYLSPEKRATMGKAAAEKSLMFTKERYAKAFFDALSLL